MNYEYLRIRDHANLFYNQVLLAQIYRAEPYAQWLFSAPINKMNKKTLMQPRVLAVTQGFLYVLKQVNKAHVIRRQVALSSGLQMYKSFFPDHLVALVFSGASLVFQCPYWEEMAELIDARVTYTNRFAVYLGGFKEFCVFPSKEGISCRIWGDANDKSDAEDSE